MTPIHMVDMYNCTSACFTHLCINLLAVLLPKHDEVSHFACTAVQQPQVVGVTEALTAYSIWVLQVANVALKLIGLFVMLT